MQDLFKRLKEVGGLTMGGAAVGNQNRPVDEQEAVNTYVAAVREGIEYVDTAPQYGLGLSESRLGCALRNLEDNKRPVISTKVGRVLVPTFEAYQEFPFVNTLPFKSEFDYTYDGIKRSVEASLNRIGVNAVDVLHIHNIDIERHEARVVDKFLGDLRDGGFRALTDLKDQGITKAIGLGNNSPEMCCRILGEFPLDVVMVARGLTLLDGSACGPLMELCRKKGVALLAAAPFCSGILTAEDPEKGAYNLLQPPQSIVADVRKIAAVCAEHAIPVQAAALQYALLSDEVAGVVLGMQQPSHVTQALEWMALELSETFWSDLFTHTNVIALPTNNS